MDIRRRTSLVKTIALEAGFARVGIAPAGPVNQQDALRFTEWIAAGRHGSMDYLARNVEQRLNPALLVEGARSVICLAAPYAPAAADPQPLAPLARSSRGRDYHKVLKRRAQALCDRLREVAPEFVGRAFVDTAPLLERSLAAAAGLGWIGWNRCLVAPGLGSYVLLCEIVCNLELEADGPAASQCGDCGACIRACPTGALSEEGLDARRCVSYLTIEHRGDIEPELASRMGCRLIGCDACQEACPHNRDVPAGEPALRASQPPLGGATLADVLAWTAEEWDAATRGSASRRATHEMFVRNAKIALKR